MISFSDKSDKEIEQWIRNHERLGKTDSELFKELLEERARRAGKILDPEKSMELLIQAAKEQRFVTYGQLAAVNGVGWNAARHRMNGSGGHLDNLLDLCHSRGLPLLTSICVNQSGADTGDLSSEALAGFVAGARRLGHRIANHERVEFLRRCQAESFRWGKG